MAAPTPPSAARRPHPLSAHGDERIDDWYWLRNAEDPGVLEYLQAENEYAEQILAPTAALQEELFAEIRSRIHETDAGPPALDGGWWYYSRTTEGLQYPIVCRRPDPQRSLGAAQVAAEARRGAAPSEEVVLDENLLAGDGEFLSVGVFDISPDHATLAYGIDRDGSERHTVRFRDLATGADLDDVLENVYYGSAWSADGSTFLYTRPNDVMRPWQVWAHELGSPQDGDRLIFQEDDERFFVDVGVARTRARIVIHTASKTSSEVRWLPATVSGSDWDPAVLLPRRPGVEYDAEHDGDSWLIRTNAPGADGEPRRDFAVLRLAGDGGEGAALEPVIEHRQGVKVEAVDSFARFIAVTERSADDGLERLRILDRAGNDHVVGQPEPAYSLYAGQNPEWDQEVFRFGYSSMVTPRTWVDYRPGERSREPVWTQIVPGYDPADYVTDRLWAPAPDGARVPISLVRRRDSSPDGTAPGLLYGYGAYEMSIDPAFSPVTMNLVRRGAVMAIAHVRGGGELGRRWYEEGRMENKPNTFSDFIAAAEYLIAEGLVAPGRLAARGGSAGGLLMGAVLNMRPDLWRVIVAEVPFVDVVTTMSDTSLPLTVTEWEEWGDPLHDADAYRRMLAYSPYDNVQPAPAYPALYVTGGLNDPNVGFWEPAKWVAKLRSVGAGTSERPLVLRTEMGAGHQGPSGRYETWRDEARIQAFVLTQVGAA